MEESILITGGGGFIGSHLTQELLDHNYRVRVLDNLSPQVHPEGRPGYLSSAAEFIEGDVRDPAVIRKALRGIDTVFHLAAAVGVGQSMYQIENYTSINNIGTAVLLEALVEQPVGKLVVASSMSIYGEGLYRDRQGQLQSPAERPLDQLRSARWELEDDDGNPLAPIPTAETKVPAPTSVYALSKYDQERLCLIVGRAYDIPTVALRFFNAYGPYQALSNPYTGVLAIFASRLLNGNRPVIFEDGLQRRDFVSVHDVAQACRLAGETAAARDMVFNVGSGHSFTVREIADRMCQTLNKEEIEPVISGKFRQGDIRHCFADIARAREVLGFEPQVAMEDGLIELASWLDGQVADDRAETASAELAKRGLTL